MPRWLLFGGIGLVLVCILCCALAFVVGLPRLRDGFEESVQDAVATEVAAQLPGSPGTTTITAESLQTSVRQSTGNDDVIVVINQNGVEIGVSDRGQEITY